MTKSNLLEVIESDVSARTPIFIVAEIGINHNGDLELAKRLIEESAKAGCDAVKFQKRTVEVVYSANVLAEPRESPWGKTQRDQKLGLELSEKDYEELKKFANSLGMFFSASAWDFGSLDFIESLEPDFHKVASAFITNHDFLSKVASFRRPTLVSTGMCLESDIDSAVNIFREAQCPFLLMHTVSVYPCPETDLNLSYIQTLQKRYGMNVGYSGHESSVSPTLCAVALGAKVIERHITVDRSMYGSDQSASLEIEGLRRLVAGIRKYPGILGNGKKSFSEEEQKVAKKLRYWE